MDRKKIVDYFEIAKLNNGLFNSVVRTICCIENLYGKDSITHLFISNELKNGEIEFDTTLWLFTDRYMIRCVDFANMAESEKRLNYEIIPYNDLSMKCNVTSATYYNIETIFHHEGEKFVLKSVIDNNVAHLKIHDIFYGAQ